MILYSRTDSCHYKEYNSRVMIQVSSMLLPPVIYQFTDHVNINDFLKRIKCNWMFTIDLCQIITFLILHWSILCCFQWFHQMVCYPVGNWLNLALSAISRHPKIMNQTRMKYVLMKICHICFHELINSINYKVIKREMWLYWNVWCDL